MSSEEHGICPVEKAGSLDNRIRRWLQNPEKILMPYVKEGMTVLDVGCGPGFFTVDMARMVGPTGRVIACDLQEGMLKKVQEKVKGTRLEERIILHKCEKNKINVTQPMDFILLFYMVHEVPDKALFFDEIKTIAKPDGQVLMVEPPFHVSKSAFEKTIEIARDKGFAEVKGPGVFLSKTVILKNRSIK